MPAGLHPNHSKFSKEMTKATSCQSNLSCPHHSQRSTPLKSGLVLPLLLPTSHLVAELWLQLNTALAQVAFQLKKKYIEKERVYSDHVSSCTGLFAISGYVQALQCTKQEQLSGDSCPVAPLQQQ